MESGGDNYPSKRKNLLLNLWLIYIFARRTKLTSLKVMKRHCKQSKVTRFDFNVFFLLLNYSNTIFRKSVGFFWLSSFSYHRHTISGQISRGAWPPLPHLKYGPEWLHFCVGPVVNKLVFSIVITCLAVVIFAILVAIYRRRKKHQGEDINQGTENKALQQGKLK